MERSLNVWINQAQVGVLRESNGLWAFCYSKQWLAAPLAHPLCPLLPLQAEEHFDGATTRPVQWYFDNLLPEEGQRHLIAKAAGAAIEDAFALLQHFGAESAGSLTLLPPGQEPEHGSMQVLPNTELSKRILAMPKIPLAEQAAKKMSLAGAQHKVAIIYKDDQLFEPTGSEPSTHILKPDHPEDAWPHTVINEWFVMKLAERVGLPVPRVQRLYIPEPIYLIERFDRVQREHGWERLHCIDACQLHGLSREFKYSAGSIERIADLANQCRPAALARLRLFQWLIFNVLLGNEDAHLKNLSFLMSAKNVHLSPFYDLLCTAVYGTRAYDLDQWPQQAEMAWPINGTQRLVDITAPLLVSAGETMGIKAATARENIRKLVGSVRIEAPKLLDEVIQQNEELLHDRPELGATLGGEVRLLRGINAIVISEMTAQLDRGL
ncbi:MAG: HipA domain-containing protein [Pseudomonas sp.]|uniref:HipA domain-containing protein n=1 Tax=Pseudomonas sp. TaxID=306 RepID=UPI001D82065C|nr:HipA domain-containing protein [Pseudomonas sp.]MBT9531241.1 HipA domain-containing protein [Pseudomonas sp.]HRL95225.1 HipA domain-containing protein [Pseudomonas sp.]